MKKMEILEESPVFNDQTAVKGKRTKRPRSSSAASSSAAAGESHRSSSFFYSSPTTSSEISTRTEEDEDMANCLIFLARGYSTPPAAAENKFSNRKFTEMATTTAGRVGIYVYECKTCSRTFQSFQALGGHRASHRKPKPTVENDQKAGSPPPPANDQEENQFGKVNTDSSLFPNKSCITNDQVKPKIHECSICGAEFASGQALGGHMRRHRAAPPIATARNEESIHNDTPSRDVNEKPRSMLAMDFDLNLPAPPEDVKFDQFSPKQQPRIVFSAAALVDCHY